MDGPGHHTKAEEMLIAGDPDDQAGTLAAIGQIHAMLAGAAATALGASANGHGRHGHGRHEHCPGPGEKQARRHRAGADSRCPPGRLPPHSSRPAGPGCSGRA